MTEPFQITVLGSGTAVPRPDRASPGYLAEIGDQNILIDPGSGALRQLSHVGVHINDVDRIIVTHLHPDHTLDLISFLFASRFPGMERKRDLEIICPGNFPKMFKGMKDLYEGYLEPKSYEIHLEEVEDVVLDFPGWKLDVYPTVHMEGSFCCSFLRDDGGKIFYSSDTAYAQTVATAAQDADIALVECSLPEDMEADGHMTPRFVGKLGDVAEPYRLVLTHLYPPMIEQDPVEQVAQYYDGHVELAEDLVTYSIFEDLDE